MCLYTGKPGLGFQTTKAPIKLVALLLLAYSCIVTVYILWLFLTVPGTMVGMQYVSVLFPDHAHLLFVTRILESVMSKLATSGITIFLLV